MSSCSRAIFFVALFAICLSSLSLEIPGKDRKAAAAAEDNGDEIRTYFIDHLIAGSFQQRARVELKFSQLKSQGSAHISQLSGEESVGAVKELAASKSLYTIRIRPSQAQLDDVKSEYVTASVPACALAASGFRELLTFHVDVYGHVMGVTYKTPVTSCQGDVAVGRSKFDTKASISMGRPAEKPKNVRSQYAAAAAAADAEAGAQQGAEGGKEAPKSFLSQYWMYIVPLALVVLSQGLAGAAGGDK